MYQSLWFGTAKRFRDNILLIVFRDVSVHEILLLFKQMMKLEFTKEQASWNIESLECRMAFKYHHTDSFFDYMELQWKNASAPQVKYEFQKIKKLVDKQSLNAKSVLQSYIPSALLKCHYYSLNEKSTNRNLIKFLMYMKSLNYPNSWLKPLLREVWKRGIG